MSRDSAPQQPPPFWAMMARRYGVCLILGTMGLFLTTTLVLYSTLSSLENQDLLHSSSDWQAQQPRWNPSWQQVMANVKGAVTSALPAKTANSRKNDGSRSRPLRGPIDNKWGQQILGHAGTGRTTARQVFEKTHDPNERERIRSHIASQRKAEPRTLDDVPYNITNCPATPPPGYPFAWKLLDILHAWNPDITQMPTQIHQGLCIFDWATEQDKALAYREAEVPFVLQDNPDVARTAERWTTPGYIARLVGAVPQRNEHSTYNHFMFWRTKLLPKLPAGWRAPTDEASLTFVEWQTKARQLEQQTGGSINHTQREHWYFRLNGDYYHHVNDYLYDELPIFLPNGEATSDSFFMVDPSQQRGINCRFGMQGVLAESHFDPTRNFVVLLGGQRRYILSHPDQCQQLELYDMWHPSGRHSKVNWSDPPMTDPTRPFAKAMANEVVLQTGDALYLPTAWFHFIVSLNENYQCNARSGATLENMHHIHECGFGNG